MDKPVVAFVTELVFDFAFELVFHGRANPVGQHCLQLAQLLLELTLPVSPFWTSVRSVLSLNVAVVEIFDETIDTPSIFEEIVDDRMQLIGLTFADNRTP